MVEALCLGAKSAAQCEPGSPCCGAGISNPGEGGIPMEVG